MTPTSARFRGWLITAGVVLGAAAPAQAAPVTWHAGTLGPATVGAPAALAAAAPTGVAPVPAAGPALSVTTSLTGTLSAGSSNTAPGDVSVAVGDGYEVELAGGTAAVWHGATLVSTSP